MVENEWLDFIFVSVWINIVRYSKNPIGGGGLASIVSSRV